MTETPLSNQSSTLESMVDLDTFSPVQRADVATAFKGASEELFPTPDSKGFFTTNTVWNFGIPNPRPFYKDSSFFIKIIFKVLGVKLALEFSYLIRKVGIFLLERFILLQRHFELITDEGKMIPHDGAAPMLPDELIK